jgi:hypothetical protein
MSASTAAARPATAQGIDPRGPQVAASLTAVVLVIALLRGTDAVGGTLLAVQAAVFAVGAVAGVQRTPYAWLFRTVIRPRLEAPSELEDPVPPRFAQAVGLFFTLIALVGLAAGVDAVALGATGLALVAALLNALFRFCLGCELYLLLKRATAR